MAIVFGMTRLKTILKEYWFPLVLGSGFLTMLAIWTIGDNNYLEQLDRSGVYVVGTVTSVTSSTRGALVKGIYYFNNKKYNIRQSVLARGRYYVGKRVFLRLLPSDPERYDFRYDETVPDCLLTADSMHVYWKTRPYCK